MRKKWWNMVIERRDGLHKCDRKKKWVDNNIWDEDMKIKENSIKK